MNEIIAFILFNLSPNPERPIFQPELPEPATRIQANSDTVWSEEQAFGHDYMLTTKHTKAGIVFVLTRRGVSESGENSVLVEFMNDSGEVFAKTVIAEVDFKKTANIESYRELIPEIPEQTYVEMIGWNLEEVFGQQDG
jgi:hypothetical protein